MTGKMKHDGNEMSESYTSERADGNMEREVAPQLPTSGQILGELVRSLGIDHSKLRSKTASRYFSGHLEDRVKESSRTEIIKAVAETLVEQGVGTGKSAEDDTSSTIQTLTTILDHHAEKWDRLRALLRPRMPRVFPSHLPDVWRSYARLAAIDLALRAAAQMRLSGASPAAMDFLDWIQVDRRGRYLDKMRLEAGVTSRLRFSEDVHVDINTVDGWVDHGSRPHTKNLRNLAKALAKVGDSDERARTFRELRRLYWASDLAELLGEHVGTEAAADIVQHLKSYAALVCDSLENDFNEESRPAALADILALGTGSKFSDPLLNAIAGNETDDEWISDIMAAGSDWVRRVLTVNHQVHQAEVDELVQKTEGGLLRDWDISSHEAYAHYRRSEELQVQGKTHEAMAEIAKAIELDPKDPANHFTMGSYKGGMGAKTGDAALITEGLEECWLAAELDPTWILPWTEVGWILFMAGRSEEAFEHLRNISSERGSPDWYYYAAFGLSLRQMGRFADALGALETALSLNPDYPPVVVATATTALLADNKAKADHYTKIAAHMGFSEEAKEHSELIRLAKTGIWPIEWGNDVDRRIQALDAALRRNPSNALAYVERARAYLEKEEDDRALSDLGSAIWLDPSNADAYLLRGYSRSETCETSQDEKEGPSLR